MVNGIYCNSEGAQFSSSVFDAVMNETQTGLILSVLLINGSDYTMSITWSDPENMKGSKKDNSYLIITLNLINFIFNRLF